MVHTYCFRVSLKAYDATSLSLRWGCCGGGVFPKGGGGGGGRLCEGMMYLLADRSKRMTGRE